MVLGFIGAGNMGGAYIKALNNEVYFYEKNKERAKEIENESKALSLDNLKTLIEKSDVIFIAVKPQILENVLKEVKDYDYKNKIFVTLVAGIKMGFYEKILGTIKLVRVMPNTPVQVKAGVAGVTFKGLSEEERFYVKSVLESCGVVIEVEEDKLDVITALSGSGPAYVFLLINALADGGVKLGLTKKDSLEIVAQTFLGSAKMFLETGIHPEILKDMVTSPGGTTAEGLAKMEELGIRSAMIETAKSTYNKAKELGRKE